jgi:peptidyl-prolyl cis-trans isomerase C
MRIPRFSLFHSQSCPNLPTHSADEAKFFGLQSHHQEKDQDVLKTNPDPVETKSASSPSPSKLLRFLKEPLLHFVLAGAAIYLLFGMFGQSESDEALAEENTIVVTEGEIDWFAEMWQKKWNRPPSDVEMVGLVQDHLRQTVLYREAVAMGLDKDDVIIRRRMAQKLEFLAQDLITPEEPTAEELQAFFVENVDRYQIPPLLTFTHVFLDPDKRGDDTLTDAEKLKAELIAGATVPDEASDLGDRFMLQAYYPERDEADLAKLFGGEFARSIMALEPEKWHGPVLSGYGTHLVYVQARLESPLPTYEQVADRVREDLVTEEREKLNQEYLDSLLARYKVVIEGGDAEEDQAADKEVSQ